MDQPIFVNRYGKNIGASGIRLKLAQYVAGAAKTVPSIARKRISPHTFSTLCRAPDYIWAEDKQVVFSRELGHARCRASVDYTT